MSKQLAFSAAFSIFAMAAYVLFGVDAAREPFGFDSTTNTRAVEISAPEMPDTAPLLPSLR
jgi:hypothetical protein